VVTFVGKAVSLRSIATKELLTPNRTKNVLQLIEMQKLSQVRRCLLGRVSQGGNDVA
jgi:hypothetical protein